MAFSSGWKVSCVARGVFQELESLPRGAWRFPAAGKFPAERVAFSSGWKVSREARGVFQRLENPFGE